MQVKAPSDLIMHWYPPYVPVGARRARALLEMRELRARGLNVQPVELKGRTIARSFWGRRWCEHLESFSDYANRLPRGRTYVRNGSVCHLEIRTGGVDAMVVGTDLYRVTVRIRKLGKQAWKAVRTACAGQIGSVLELLQGRLSDHVMDVVTDRDTGLFPKPRQIELACDCPDWATMCKHAAAALYGVGSRLDDRPELLFLLRGVDEAELIAADMALPRGTSTADTLADDDLGDIFGIDLGGADGAPDPPARKRPTRTARARTRPGSRRTSRRTPGTSTASGPAAAPDTGEPASGFHATGELVARLRRRGGFSAAEFAALLHVSTATVRRWEAASGPLAMRPSHRDALAALRRAIEKQAD